MKNIRVIDLFSPYKPILPKLSGIINICASRKTMQNNIIIIMICSDHLAQS